MQKITLSVAQINEINASIHEILKLDICHVFAYELGVIKSSLSAYIENYHSTRNSLLKKYGKPNESDPSKYDLNDSLGFHEEEKKLLNKTHEIELEKIPLSKFESVKGGRGVYIAYLVPIIEKG